MKICFSCQEPCELREDRCQEEQAEPFEINEQDFIRAVCTGDLAIVQAYILMHPQAVNLQKRGDTPLHIAIDCSRESVVRHLLRIGADVEARNARGETVLHNAVLGRHFSIVRALIEHEKRTCGESVLINKENQWGRTALFLAVDTGNRDVVNYLLRHGARLSGDTEHTPLGWALYRGYYHIVSLLIRYGDELWNVPPHLKVNAQRTARSFPWLSERREYEADVEALLASDDICRAYSVPIDLVRLILFFIREEGQQDSGQI